MSTTLHKIQRRRELLLARSELQRTTFRIRMRPVRNTIARVDRIIAALYRAQHHPAIVGAVAIAMILFARRRMWRTLRIGLSTWQTIRLITRLKRSAWPDQSAAARR